MTITKRLKYHLITGSDVLQGNHVPGRTLVFHGPAISLSLPLLSLCSQSLWTPPLSLSPSHYLCLSLPKSVLLQRTLFFNPIWWGPQLSPPTTRTTLPHGEMYANVARLQKWKLGFLHSHGSQRQCDTWKTLHCSITNPNQEDKNLSNLISNELCIIGHSV